EQTGNHSEAAHEYLTAAGEAWYDFLEAQYLLDAGRVLVIAGDTTTALNTYQRVISDFGDTQQAVEARVRLGELEATKLPI
ncbi:MAG: hypothetical protein JSW71_02485, partial [Gemmatimonadota bacterium]